MNPLGHYCTLPVTKALDFGFYLDAGEPLGEVLLPRRYAPPGLEVGERLDVFLYLDSEDRPIATTEKPRATVGQCALLDCVSVSSNGAFLDWGLSKDVMVPFAEQHRPMEPGRHYLAYLYIDKYDGRITASTRLEKHLRDDRPHAYRQGEPVSLIVAGKSDLGTKMIINHSHWGLLHHADTPEGLRYGQTLSGFIKRVRPDGKIDLSLQSVKDALDVQVEQIVSWLQAQGGHSDLTDKASPEQIRAALGMSKTAFKKAVGMLMSAGRLVLGEQGMTLREVPAAQVPSATKAASAPQKRMPPRQTTSEASPAKKPWAGAVKAETKGSPDRAMKAVKADSPWQRSGEQREVRITREPVELFKLLKFEALVGSGGEAKQVIEDGLVLVNGRPETRKRKKLQAGDSVTFNNETLTLVRA